MPSKTTKDINAPKKPLTAYMLFSIDERPKLKASGLDNFAEMSKALGAAWKQADTKIRARYEKEHEREKTRYEGELKNYQKSGEPAPSSITAQKSQPPVKSKTAAAPAKPTTKQNTPAVKNGKHESEDDHEGEEHDEEGSDEEEEEEEPAPPVKGSRKKI